MYESCVSGDYERPGHGQNVRVPDSALVCP